MFEINPYSYNATSGSGYCEVVAIGGYFDTLIRPEPSESWVNATYIDSVTAMVDFEMNDTPYSRSATVKFTSSMGYEEEFTLNQASGGSVQQLVISPTTYSATTSEETSTYVYATQGNFNQSITPTFSPSSASSWIDVTFTSDSSAYVSLERNTGNARQATVTFSGVGGSTADLTVKQPSFNPPTLSISPTSLTFSAFSLDAQTITATTNLNLVTPTASDSWVHINWNGTTKVASITCDGYTGSSYRTATVTFTDAVQTLTATATIRQNKEDIVLFPASDSSTYPSGTTTVGLSAGKFNTQLDPTSDSSWLSATYNNSYYATVSFTQNSGASRTGHITFNGVGGSTAQYTFTQGGFTGFSFNPTGKTLTTPDAATQTLTAVSGTAFNIGYSPVASDSWMTGVVQSNFAATAAIAANTGTTQRTGTITYGGPNSQTAVFTWVQPGLSCSLSKTSITSPASGDSTYATFTHNDTGSIGSLSATPSHSWIVASVSGNQINISIGANSTTSTRSGSIAVTYGGWSGSISVSQSAMECSLSTSTVNRGTPDSGTSSVSFTTNVDNLTLSASTSSSWITPSVSNGKINIRVAANPTTTSRSGSVSVTYGGWSGSITVNQPAMSVSISPTEKSVTCIAQSFEVALTSNVSTLTLSATTSQSWISTSVDSARKVVTVSVNDNYDSTTGRNGTVTITYGSWTGNVSVTQDRFSPSVAVSPSTYTFSNSGGTLDFTGTTNMTGGSWTVTSTLGTLTTSTLSQQTVTGRIVVDANGGSSRTGTCSLTYSGMTATINMTQESGSTYITPTSHTYAQSGGTLTVTGFSTISGQLWSVTSKPSWIESNVLSNHLTFTAGANNDTAQRTGTIGISYGNWSGTVEVSQYGNVVSEIIVSPSSIYIPLSGGTETATLTCNYVSNVAFSGSMPSGISATISGNIATITATSASTAASHSLTISGTSTMGGNVVTAELKVYLTNDGTHYQIWQDEDYSHSTQEAYVNYGIYLDGVTNIYSGRAYKLEGENAIIFNINNICENYLKSDIDLEGISTTGFSIQNVPYYSRNFMLTKDSVGDVLGNYRFFNSWSYEPITKRPVANSAYFISDPIDFLVDDRQYFMASFYGDNGTISYQLNTDSGSTSFSGWQMKTVINGNLFPGTLTVNGQNYTVKRTCAEYVIYYVNSWGGWDSLLVRGNSKRDDSLKHYSTIRYSNNQTPKYRKETYTVEIQPSYTFHTANLTDEQSRKMKNLLESRQVYIMDLNNRTFIPVVITNKNCEEMKYRNGRKMNQYAITVDNSQIFYRK